MEECMRDSMRKLALWHTRTFKPLMTHDELEPIMSTIGFIGLPHTTGFKEYVFLSDGRLWSPLTPTDQSPRPRLPYPHIDGLHIYTYQAFIDALGFYLDVRHVSDRFHVRGMPLQRVNDKNRKWLRMEEDESVFVYRDGTLEKSVHNLYKLSKGGQEGAKSGVFVHDKSLPVCTLLPLKDIIVLM